MQHNAADLPVFASNKWPYELRNWSRIHLFLQFMRERSSIRSAVLIASLLLGVGATVAAGLGQAGGSQPPQQPAGASGSPLAKADAAYHAGRLDEARRWLKQAIQNDPRSARAHALLGLVLARQGDVQGALRNLRQAHEIELQNPDYAYNYAVLLEQDGQFAAAIPILEGLRQKSPRSDDILVNLARAYAGAGDIQKLVDTASHLSAADYANQPLLKTLATILAGAGQTSATAELWQGAIRHDPNQALPYAALAELWIGQGQSSQALALLDGAPAAARGPLYLYAYGDAQMALRNYQKAIPVFLDLIRRSPDDQGPWQKLVRCNMLVGHLNEAEQTAEEASRHFPGAPEFQYQQAVVNYLLGRSATAMRALAPLVKEKGGEDTRPVLLMAVLKSQSGEYQEASGYFERVDQMQVGCNALASYFYGATLLRMHRLPEAEVKLEGAIRCHPRFALAEYRLGEALSQDGKSQQALAALEQATRDDPTLAEPYYALAQIRQRQGDQAGAREALARFTSLQKRGSNSEGNLFAAGLP
jgi:superkiller protein 3